MKLKTKNSESGPADEAGIVLPALLWWMGVPLTLLVVLYLLGMFR